MLTKLPGPEILATRNCFYGKGCSISQRTQPGFHKVAVLPVRPLTSPASGQDKKAALSTWCSPSTFIRVPGWTSGHQACATLLFTHQAISLALQMLWNYRTTFYLTRIKSEMYFSLELANTFTGLSD